MRKLKKQNAITLVALVITIVILLILAGISISALTNTGIFEKAKEAKKASENSEEEQRETLSEYEKELNKYSSEELTTSNANVVLSVTENVELHDKNGNKIVVPAGFKVVVNDDTNNAMTVDKGIVIEDGMYEGTKGSQFVWVPVGNILKEDDSNVDIKLNRYDFDQNTGKENTYSGDDVEEDANDETILNSNKAIAKNITAFKTSVISNDGYYVGRFESRTTKERNSWLDELTQITEKSNDSIYNYITQKQASQLSQNMYNTSKFTSDLMNSYAWDTSILFIQKCSMKTKYSYQTCINKSLSQIGTIEDKQCNIFDMASNVLEWTTETCRSTKYPCVGRGSYYSTYSLTCGRYHIGSSGSVDYIGFRPILYINN